MRASPTEFWIPEFRIPANLRSLVQSSLALPVLILAGLVAPAGTAAQQGSTGSAAAVEALPHVAPESVGLSATGLAEITALMNEFVTEGRIAGAVAGVARRGGIAYLGSAGFQNLESRTPMSEHSLFRIYSMTKAVTSVAAMILWEEGRFQLDDPASRYLPALAGVRVRDEATGGTRPPSHEITVRDLILHTSGLNHRTSAIYRDAEVRRRDISMDQFIANLVAVPLMEDPGTRYRYSESTTVLGALVEVWSGVSFDQFVAQRILAPLGMVDTGFQVRPDQLDRWTTVYGRGQDGGPLTPVELEAIPFTERPTLLEGAVGLVSTVPDFLRFSQMLLNGGEFGGVRLLRPETVDMMTENGLSDAVQAVRGGSMGWGLANVNVHLDPSALSYPSNLGEYGWDGSAGTIFWNDPTTETTIVLMWQSSPANPEQLRQRIKTLVHEARLD